MSRVSTPAELLCIRHRWAKPARGRLDAIRLAPVYNLRLQVWTAPVRQCSALYHHAATCGKPIAS